MNKDPAFLFYTSDFLTGTMFMTDEEVGVYIRLLCVQHQHGGLIEKDIFTDRANGFPRVSAKFIETEDGYFNERLGEEMAKRAGKSRSMSANAMHRWAKAKQMQCKSNAIAMQTENDNANALDVSSAVNRSGERTQVLGAPPDIQAASMCPHLRRVSDAYPKPNGHRAAYRTWAALIAEGHNAQELADKCVAAIDLYKNSEEWAKDKGAYIPDLASWLDKGRWEDKPTPKLRRGISPEGQKILDKIFEEEQARNAYRRNDT